MNATTGPERKSAPSDMLTREQACELLNVSETTIKRLEGLRRFKRFKDGRLVRYSRRELERYIASRTTEHR